MYNAKRFILSGQPVSVASTRIGQSDCPPLVLPIALKNTEIASKYNKSNFQRKRKHSEKIKTGIKIMTAKEVDRKEHTDEKLF